MKKQDEGAFAAATPMASQPGMSIREYMATALLQGMLARGMATGDRLDDALEAVLRTDALLKALDE